MGGNDGDDTGGLILISNPKGPVGALGASLIGKLDGNPPGIGDSPLGGFVEVEVKGAGPLDGAWDIIPETGGFSSSATKLRF